MVLTTGAFFVAFAVLAEILGGTMFRSYFDWKNYPPRYPEGVHGNDERIRTIAARVTMVVGVGLVIVGAIGKVL